jgi:hypothetical protein
LLILLRAIAQKELTVWPLFRLFAFDL